MHQVAQPSAQAAGEPAPIIPVLKPCAQIPVPAARNGDALGGPVLFDTQRSLVYVRALDWTPHGWGLIKWYAPDVGAIALILILFVAVTRTRRILRHPQHRASWYCRRCNYELSGPHAQAPCPECGSDPGKARPRQGRAAGRRLAVLCLSFIPSASLCVAGLVWGLQRYEGGGAFNSRPWPTIYMGYLGPRWLFSKPLGAVAWRTNRERAYDLASGQPAAPELPLVRGDNFGHFLARDGRWLATIRHLRSPVPHADVVLQDTASGVIRRIRLSDSGLWNPFELRHSRDPDGKIFIQAISSFDANSSEFTTLLFELDPQAPDSQAVRRVASVVLPTVPSTMSGNRMLTNTTFAARSVGGETEWALLNTHFGPNTATVQAQELITPSRGSTQAPLHRVPITGPSFGEWVLRFASTGSSVETEDNSGWTTWSISTTDGAATQVCSVHRGALSRSDNGVCLYLNSNDELEVALDGRPPLAILRPPPGNFTRPMDISPDGRWAAACLYDTTRPALCPRCVPATRSNTILIWDLQEILPTTLGAPVTPVPPARTP